MPCLIDVGGHSLGLELEVRPKGSISTNMQFVIDNYIICTCDLIACSKQEYISEDVLM